MADVLYSFPVVKPILAEDDDPKEVDVRLDKWLWAARFYKTRTLARQAVEGGKVQCNGQRTRPTKSVEVGDALTISQGPYTRQLVVCALSKQRRSAPEAAQLYEETEESRLAREALAEERSFYYGGIQPQGCPNQQDRRRARFLRRGLKQKPAGSEDSEFEEEPEWDSE